MAEKQEEKRVGFFQRTKRSIKMSFNEFKKVHWPSKKELLTYTGVALAAIAGIAIMIWLVDSAIGALFGLIL